MAVEDSKNYHQAKNILSLAEFSQKIYGVEDMDIFDYMAKTLEDCYDCPFKKVCDDSPFTGEQNGLSCSEYLRSHIKLEN